MAAGVGRERKGSHRRHYGHRPLLGPVEKNNEIVPVASTHRNPFDTTGLDFIKSTVSVTSPGFNWVKGKVLKHEKKIKTNRWDIQPSLPKKVLDEVSKINQKIDIMDRVKKAKEKALEINKKLVEKERKNKWVKVKSKKPFTVTVSSRNTKETIRSIMKSGITDFRILVSYD